MPRGRRDAGARGGEPGRGRSGRGGEPSRAATPARPLPYRVARWGKFWSLEPLFADARACLVAKGGPTPRLDDIVLAIPSHGDRRRIVETLGRDDDLDTVLRAMLYAKDVRQGFSPDVLEEAAAVRARTARPDHGRHDLGTLPTFTIDPDTARDFDDAISVAREGDGYRAHVHIADVSYFVDADGAIEAEARRRTSSLYLPLFAEPMLPPALSTDACSLVPGEPRKCLTVEFTFRDDGRRSSVQFYRSLIRSDHRLTYSFADEVIAPAAVGEVVAEAAPGVTAAADEALIAHLHLAYELAMILRRRRHERGALTIGSFEPEYAFDGVGLLVGAKARPETPSHALVEEFMLAANEAVAEFLLRKKAHTLYRVHEPPAAAGARELLDQLEELGIPTPSFPAGEGVPAAQFAEAYGRISRAIAEASVREHRGRLAWPNLLLRSLKQARYGPANLGHFGLASPAYLHFTSPIRRYPDLVTHRSLLHHIGEGGGELGEADLAAAGEDCSTREREFARLELDADDIALCFLLETRLREKGWEQVFSGEITGLIGGGLFVQFGGVHDGFLPSRRLGERFEVSEHETALIGQATGRRLRLGDALDVRVEHIDRLRGKVDLVPASEAPQRPLGRTDHRPARRAAGGRQPRRRAPGATHTRRGR